MNVRHVINVRCGKCDTLFELGQEGVISIPLPAYPEVLNFGVVCPNGCWTHSFYTTTHMQKQAQHISRMTEEGSGAGSVLRARETYQKTFEQFQIDMTARLAQDRINAGLDERPSEP